MISISSRFTILLAFSATAIHAGVLPQLTGQQIPFHNTLDGMAPVSRRDIEVALDAAVGERYGRPWNADNPSAPGFLQSRLTRRRKSHGGDDDSEKPEKIMAPLPDSFVNKGKAGRKEKSKHIAGSHHEEAHRGKQNTNDGRKYRGKGNKVEKRRHSHLYYEDFPIRLHHSHHDAVVIDSPILIGGHGRTRLVKHIWKRSHTNRGLDTALWKGKRAHEKKRHHEVVVETVHGHHHPHVDSVTFVDDARHVHLHGRQVINGGEFAPLSHPRSQAKKRTDQPAVDLLPHSEASGTIDIISHVAGSPSGKRIASLVFSPASDNKSFVLNASNSTSTKIQLVPVPSAPPLADGVSRTVKLHIPAFLSTAAEVVLLCCTFDPNPPAPAPLMAMPCNATITPHSSQYFAYNPESGNIRPLWMVDAAEISDDAMPGNATYVEETVTGAVSAPPAETPNQSYPDSPLPVPENVTMVFTPDTHAIIHDIPSAPKAPTTFLPGASAQGDIEMSPPMSQSPAPGPSTATSTSTEAKFETTTTVSGLAASSTASMPLMSPIVPEPYEWMFRPGDAKDPRVESD